MSTQIPRNLPKGTLVTVIKLAGMDKSMGIHVGDVGYIVEHALYRNGYMCNFWLCGGPRYRTMFYSQLREVI